MKRKALDNTDTGIILKSVLECSDNIVIYCLDEELRYVYYNQCHERLMREVWGYEIKVGTCIVDTITDARDRSIALGNYRRALSGENVRLTQEYRFKPGNPLYRETIYNPIRTDDGAIIGMVAFVMDVTDHKRTEQELNQRTRELDKRIKELQGIYTIATITEQRNVDLGEILQQVVDYLPGCWQYPEIARACIRLGRKTFTTAAFSESAWCQNCTIDIDGEDVGTLEIYYLEARPLCDEGPFLKEERDLLDSVAVHVARTIKRKEIENEIFKHKEYLEELVAARTRELSASKQALESQSRHLAEVNTALRILLDQREKDKRKLEDTLLLNVKELITPYVHKLKGSALNPTQETLVDIVESNLNNIVSPFLNNLNMKLANLTPTEIQVANLVKQGKTNGEIAEILCISVHTVTAHRYHIRTKLGLKNKKINLRTHLRGYDLPLQ
jgi:PAS domain S-box-containing protein